MFLLDCVEPLHPGQTTDTQAESAALLSQACELLSSSGQGVVAFKVIQALVTLGRADVALSLHWAHAASKPGPATATTELSQAMTLLDLRLRCGRAGERCILLVTVYQRCCPEQACVVSLLQCYRRSQIASRSGQTSSSCCSVDLVISGVEGSVPACIPLPNLPGVGCWSRRS